MTIFRKWKQHLPQLQRKTEGKKESKRDRKREKKAPQQGLKEAKPKRSSLPPSHIRTLILMRLPVFPPSVFFPLDDLNMKNLKSANSRSCVSQFDPEPHSRHQPWQTRCSKQAGAAFIRGSWCFFYSVTPPAHAICLFLKSELQDVLSAYALFLGGLHNQGPASCRVLLLCCLLTAVYSQAPQCGAMLNIHC